MLLHEAYKDVEKVPQQRFQQHITVHTAGDNGVFICESVVGHIVQQWQDRYVGLALISGFCSASSFTTPSAAFLPAL
jgi:hypothetical protein